MSFEATFQPSKIKLLLMVNNVFRQKNTFSSGKRPPLKEILSATKNLFFVVINGFKFMHPFTLDTTKINDKMNQSDQ